MNTHCKNSYRSIVIIRATKVSALCLGFCALVMAVAVNAKEPRFITFDAPGAGTGSGQGTGCFAGTDCSVLINNFGVITGYYLDANNVFHGFVRSPEGKFTTLDAPGADLTANDFNGTVPNAINDAGAITGAYYDVNNVGHGFLRSPEGGFTSFDAPGSAGYTNPVAINLESGIVGYYGDPNGQARAFLRRPDGSLTTWSGPGACTSAPPGGFCGGTAAFSINVFGTVAGGYGDANLVSHVLIRTPAGTLQTFSDPNAGTGSGQGTGCPGCSRGLNVFGVIASYYIDANYVTHGFVRSPWGQVTTFDPPGEGPYGIGCAADCPIGLNDLGAITGIYLDANNVYHGFVRSPDGTFTTFDAPGADLTPNDFNGTFPYSINDWGVITGYYIDKNNVSHGFLLLP
jgi:uncharacterized membrane protein